MPCYSLLSLIACNLSFLLYLLFYLCLSCSTSCHLQDFFNFAGHACVNIGHAIVKHLCAFTLKCICTFSCFVVRYNFAFNFLHRKYDPRLYLMIFVVGKWGVNLCAPVVTTYDKVQYLLLFTFNNI